jgi:SanA protein
MLLILFMVSAFHIFFNKMLLFMAWVFLPVIALILFVVLVINYRVLSFSSEWFYQNIESLPPFEVWLVFWASVKRNGEPSDVLKDRLIVASQSYKAWKVKKIIVSWDNSQEYYNEPIAMEKFLIWEWVSKDDIYLDYAGFDTYDSVYRAKHIFWAEKILYFTQDFHLKRAVYIWKKLWIESYWIETNLHIYKAASYNTRREILARVKAFLDVDINSSKPKFLGNLIDMSMPQEK